MLSESKIHHISPADMDQGFEERDFVDAQWPADGNQYDVKIKGNNSFQI